VIVGIVSRAKLIQIFKNKKCLKFFDIYREVYITYDLRSLRYKIIDIVMNCPGTTNVFTRDWAIHCTYQKKHIVFSSPDDLFDIDVMTDLNLLGLKHLM
jgi:hypothetical protein